MDAFRQYDFDNDSNWKDYLRSVEIPSGDQSKLLKVKAKWYKRAVDPDFDVSLVSSSDTPTQSSTAERGEPNREPPSSSTSFSTKPTSAQQRSAPSATAPAPVRTQYMDIALFCIHFALVLLGAVSIVPVFPVLSVKAYRAFLQATMVAQGIKVYKRFGLPKLPFAALKQWASTALPTTDFHYLSLAIIFLPQPPVSLIVAPIAIIAVYHASTYLNRRYCQASFYERCGLGKAHQYLALHQRDALMINTAAEISLGFVLIIQLFLPSRNILLLFFYWQMLRLRYWTPDSSLYHQMVWRQVDTMTAPYRNRMPIVNTVIGYGERWFLSAPQRGPA